MPAFPSHPRKSGSDGRASDADTRVCRDGCHGHVRTRTVHDCRRGANEGLVVAGRVAALFARTGLLRGGHALIEAASGSQGKAALKRTKSSGGKIDGVASGLDGEVQAAFIAKSKALAPEYKTELLPPP